MKFGCLGIKFLAPLKMEKKSLDDEKIFRWEGWGGRESRDEDPKKRSLPGSTNYFPEQGVLIERVIL